MNSTLNECNTTKETLGTSTEFVRGSVKELFSPIKSIPELLKQKHLPSLDGIRAISIITVLICHANRRYNNAAINWVLGDGRLGVYVFFVISGFLITTLLIKEKLLTGKISLRSFYIRRVFRIIPVAYFYLLAVFVIGLIFKMSIPVTEFLGAMFFVMNYRYFHHDVWLTGHYWSLSVEEQFYLLFPLLFKKNFKAYIIFLFSFLFVIITARYLAQYTEHLHKKNFLTENKEVIGYFDGIIIGCLLAVFTAKNLINYKWIIRNKIWLHLCCIPLLIIIFNNHLPKFYLSPFKNLNTIICSVFIAILILSNLEAKEDFLFRFLNNKIIRKIGVLSYSLYIYNMLFTPNAEYPYTKLLPTYHWPVVVNMSLLFLVAYLSYHFLESPILKLKHKFSTVKQ